MYLDNQTLRGSLNPIKSDLTHITGFDTYSEPQVPKLPQKQLRVSKKVPRMVLQGK